MDEDFHYVTDAEWDREGAAERGYANPELAWVLSDRDVWYANPYYRGPKVPHPEDDSDLCDVPRSPFTTPVLDPAFDEEIPF